MARKFIITTDVFIMGNVELHMDLVSRQGKFTNPILGGGRWHTDLEKKILYLWGASTDFGYAKPDQIKRAIESPETWLSRSLNGWNVFHSPIISNELPEIDTFTFLTVVSQ